MNIIKSILVFSSLNQLNKCDLANDSRFKLMRKKNIFIFISRLKGVRVLGC